MRTIAICLVTLSSLSGWAATGKGSNMQNHSVNSEKIKMRVGSNSFVVTLLDNESTKRFKDLFPLTVLMKDLHSNEKFYDLPKALPENASVPNRIKAGDIMLYRSKTIVLFYKSFSTTYSYTKLGQVNAASKLESALGSGDVTLTFAFEFGHSPGPSAYGSKLSSSLFVQCSGAQQPGAKTTSTFMRSGSSKNTA